MKPAPFAYHRAHSVGEAVALLAELGDEAKILAGGLSLVPMMNFRLARPAALVDVTRIEGLSYLRADPDGPDERNGLRIGALTTHRTVEISRDPAVLAGFGVLPRSARWIGHYPIRSRGTFGGSIAHADPASEWCLLAVLLGGRVMLTGPDGQRTVPAAEFFQGYYTTAARPVARRAWLAERDQIRRAGQHAGIGYACFSERTAYGTPAMSQRRMRMTPGYDTALVRMDPTGEVIVTTGTCGHGQGHETTFAQIVADRLGVHPDQVRLRQGDTDLASYGWGTWGSRSVVIGGGAAARAADLVAGQLRKAAARLLEASPADVELAEGSARIRGDAGVAIPIAELARMVHFQAHRLDEDLRYGLEARVSYDPPGTFSNACHVAMVTIDPGTCAIRLHRYLVVEDRGVVINPMVVDGQVRGGVTQGAAAALLERVCFGPEGQPASATLMDYLAPTAAEMCPVDIVHLQTPSRFSETGAKGTGEGGMIGAPAAVQGAINDALSDTDVRFDHIPVLPQDLSAALSKAGAAP